MGFWANMASVSKAMGSEKDSDSGEMAKAIGGLLKRQKAKGPSRGTGTPVKTKRGKRRMKAQGA